MSVLRIKSYHSERAIQNSLDYTEDHDKTNVNYRTGADPGMDTYGTDIGENITNAFSYSINPDKTHYSYDGGEDILVSGHNCKPDVAATAFSLARDLYYEKGHTEILPTAKAKRIMRAKLNEEGNPVLDKDGNMVYDENAPVYKDPDTGKAVYQEYEYQKQPRTAYMWVMSFAGKRELGYEVDPRLVHEIGKRFCEEFLPDYPATISTHVNTDHYHNHIVQSAYAMDGTHKYIDNMDSLKRARDICDDLSKEFGLPIIINPKTDRGVTWFEWKKKLDGESWKQQMREDIRSTMEVSDSFEEFKELMEESGYTLRETDRHITYYMPNADPEGIEYRCRDSRLNVNGDSFDYSKENIEQILLEKSDPEKALEACRVKEQTRKALEQKKKGYTKLYVQRYTIDGRRRSDLELILIQALKVISLLMDRFRPDSPPAQTPVYYPATKKLEMVTQTLNAIQERGIGTKEELDQEVNKAGMALSQLKRQYKEQDEVYAEEKEILSKIDEALDLIKVLEAMDIRMDDLYLHDYDENEVRQEKAKLTPMTQEQKRNLYIAISSSPVFRLSVKYDELTFQQAQSAIDFLNGRSSIKPDILTDISEQGERRLKAKYDKAYESRATGLKNKYAGQAATDYQIKKVKEIIESDSENPKLKGFEGIKIDTDTLSYYDAFRFISYMKSENEFAAPPADEKTMEELNRLLQENGLSAHRQFITQSEAEKILSYIKDKKGRMPDLLKEEKEGTAKEVARAEELLALTGEKVTIPLDQMTAPELFRLCDYLLLKDRTPEILSKPLIEKRNDQDLFFTSYVQDYNLGEQQILYRCRDLLNELKKLGMDPERLLEARTELEESINARNDTKKRMDVLSEEYRSLKQIQYNLTLARNRKFTHGALFDGTDVDIEKVEKIDDVRSEDRVRQEAEERSIEEKRKQEKGKTTRDSYFDNIM